MLDKEQNLMTDSLNKDERDRTWVKLENSSIDNKFMELTTTLPKTTHLEKQAPCIILERISLGAF